MNKIILIFFIGMVIVFSGCSSHSSSYMDYYRGDISSTSKRNYTDPKMKPYVVRGVTYYPTLASVGDTFRGIASWYGPDFHGKRTSNGEKYNMYAMTAAHKTLPMNTLLRVTNRRNGKSVVVRVNDRGPFVSTRIIDLSKAAASQLDMIATGTAPVLLEVIGFEGKDGVRRNTFHHTPTYIKKPSVPIVSKPIKTEVTSGFALQIASFVNIDGALRTQKKYDNINGYRTIIKDVHTQNGRVFKVLLKGFKSEQEARNYKKNGLFYGAFIVRD